MRCGKCGAELLAGKPFCHACGARVTLACRGCGAALDSSYRFCPDCGTPVSGDVHDDAPPATADSLARLSQQMPSNLATKIRATRGVIEGERKQVTVLFCDLAGSTAIAERIDPEEYHDLLDEYLALAFREIYRFEGIVNQLAGDGMMSLFGAPVAHEDAPQRAVRAALAIHEALKPLAERLRAERGIELAARIGINTGPVVVGSVGNDLKMDYSAIGDTTNLAARLEALARPGSILISDATHRLVRGFFDVRQAGPFDVKGKREPVVAHEVLGYAETATPMTVAAERGLTPFVGRDDELAQLETCYRRMSGGQAQVVAVVGDAGCGKSRLLYELKQRIGDEPVFFEARCSSMSQAAPFHPFVTMLRTYFGIVSGEDPARARAKVAEVLGVCDDRLERRFPLLGRFMAGAPIGAPSDAPPDQLKRESFEAVTGLVLGESTEAPVVVLLEDLQWIDDASRELLDNLLARLDRAPVMVVMTQRPHDAAGWRTPAALTQIVLRRLADDDVRAIIRAIAGGPLPPALERRLVAKADGSPFFAEEITNALVEEGVLVKEDGRCTVTRPVEQIPVPGTVQEVIAARLDRLRPEGKRVLQVAAVLGRQFNRQNLLAVLDGESVDVDAELAELERRGLLHRKHLLANDDYRFGESLTQEVAYEGLLLRQRRQLHERIGDLLEAGMDGAASAERAALVAHHFARGDDRSKAIAALVRAGVQARDLPSYRTAADFFRKAFVLVEGMPDAELDPKLVPLVLEAISGLCALTVVFGAPYVAEATRAAARGRPLAAASGNAELLSGITYFNGILMMMTERDQFAQGLALAEEGMAIAQRAGLVLQTARLARGLCIYYVHDGRFELARRAIEWVLQELEPLRTEHPDLYISARWIQELVLYGADELDAAHAHAVVTYEIAERASNRTMRSASAGMLAAVHFVRGEYAEAKRWADVSLAVAQEITNLAGISAAAATGLASRVELGEPVELERSLEAIEQGLGVASASAINLRFVGEAFLAIDDVPRAARYVETLRGHVGGRLRDAQVASLHGDVLTRQSRFDEAARSYTEAIGLSEAIGARSMLAVASVGAAELATARGDRKAATRHMERGLELCTALRLGRYGERLRRLATTPESPAPSP